MHNAVARMDGADHFVPSHLINAKDNRATMVAHANLDLVGFVVCVHKDSRDQIVE